MNATIDDPAPPAVDVGYPVPYKPFPKMTPEELAVYLEQHRASEGPLKYDTFEQWFDAMLKARTAAEFYDLLHHAERLPLAERPNFWKRMLREQAAEFGVTLPKRWSRYNFERK